MQRIMTNITFMWNDLKYNIFKNIDNPAYEEVYNNRKWDNRENYYLSQEQVERLRELWSIMVHKNQRKIIWIDRTCKEEKNQKMRLAIDLSDLI